MLKFLSVGLMSATLLAIGCGPSETVLKENNNKVVNSQYTAATEPAGAIPVGEARQSSEDGQEITLVGIIGGSSKPFVEGLAAFTVVDPKVAYCGGDDKCPTPWDYCCTQDQVKDNVATVKIVDDAGNPVAKDARDLLDVKELSAVVVTGKAKRDEQGNLTVAADKVFVRTGQ